MLKLILSRKIFVLIFLFSFATFLAHTYFTKTAIFADGRFYYAITRSLVKDFDIRFENDFPPLGITPTETSTGYTWNKYPPGAPIFWMPLFYTADAYSYILENIGIAVDISGFGIFYQSAVAISTIFIGTFGLYLVYQLLKDYFSDKVSLLTTLALFGTTNLLFYLAVEPINSHGVSFFTSALFVFYFLKHQKTEQRNKVHRNTKKYYFTLGVLGGIAGLVRTQDILILALPIIQVFLENRYSLKSLTTKYYLLATGALIAFLPQIIMWKLIFNTFWYSPYVNEGFFFFNPKIVHVLFNTQNGLFILTPVIAVSLLGLILTANRLRHTKIFSESPLAKILNQVQNDKLLQVSLYSLAYFLIQLYLISSWSSYSQIGSYSIRMIISTYPLLAFGLATVVKLTKEKIGLIKTFSLIAFISLVNSLLIIRYLLLY